MSARPTIVAVLTVHNRRPLTLACLDALAAQELPDHDLQAVLFDDGSTDGTAAAVAEAHPWVEVLSGDGSFFWNGGMRVALAAAAARRPDHLLWVNDDTVLAPGAVRTLLDTHDAVAADGPAIVVGTVADPDTGRPNYSGVAQDRVRRMWFEPVIATGRARQADTMNGNCVLVPLAVWDLVGNLDPGFTHSMGDYDYGLRARRRGARVWVAPGVVATCPSNPGFVPQGDSGIAAEFTRLRGTKHLPPGEWLRFVRRWGGPLWPAFWISPYIRRLGWILRSRGSTGRAQRAATPPSDDA